jgi:hypothetical protein
LNLHRWWWRHFKSGPDDIRWSSENSVQIHLKVASEILFVLNLAFVSQTTLLLKVLALLIFERDHGFLDSVLERSRGVLHCYIDVRPKTPQRRQIQFLSHMYPPFRSISPSMSRNIWLRNWIWRLWGVFGRTSI